MNIDKKSIAIGDTWWTINANGKQVSIVDFEGRERCRIKDIETALEYLAVALDQLPFESNDMLDEVLRKSAEKFFEPEESTE